jgi:hypothetical protein
MSSIPGALRSVGQVAGSPPLRGPLAMIAHARVDRLRQRRRYAFILAVDTYLVDIHRADGVIGAHQLAVVIPFEVGHV